MYHVAPAQAAARIAAEGLRPGGQSPWESPQHSLTIYLYDDLQSALDYADCRRDDGRIVEPLIFVVNVSGLALERDPEADPNDPYDYRYRCRTAIPPERVRRA
jgi:hypothetical protein